VIDSSAQIHATADVEADVSIGPGTTVWHHAQIRRGARIGRDGVIGRDVFIDESVTLGDRVKVQNRALVYHGVTIEDDVFIGPGAILTNLQRHIGARMRTPEQFRKTPQQGAATSTLLATSPLRSIALSTASRRARAACGKWKGSYADGACGRPASKADCASVRSFACLEKYVSAAASIPYAWLP